MTHTTYFMFESMELASRYVERIELRRIGLSYEWYGPYIYINFNGIKDSIAVVIDTDTYWKQEPLTKGSYILWHDSLYTADRDILTDETLYSYGANKNLTAVSNGGLNDLKSVLPKTGTVTQFTDGTGRILLSVPLSKLLAVSVESTGYWCYPRYHTDGTMVYVRVVDSFNVAANIEVVLNYIYLP